MTLSLSSPSRPPFSKIFKEFVEVVAEYTDELKSILIEDIKLLVDMFIWGDKNNDEVFE